MILARSVTRDTETERMPGVEERDDSIERTQAPHLASQQEVSVSGNKIFTKRRGAHVMPYICNTTVSMSSGVIGVASNPMSSISCAPIL